MLLSDKDKTHPHRIKMLLSDKDKCIPTALKMLLSDKDKTHPHFYPINNNLYLSFMGEQE